MSEATDKNWRSTVALGVAVLSLLVSSLTLYWSYFRHGELVVYAPTSFCIVRGYADLGFKSDHLVVPFVIENTGKGAKIFEQPTLRLTEKTNSHEPVIYTPAGTLSDLYRNSMDRSYEIGYGWQIPEISVARYFVVFHIRDWWDPNKPEYFEFQFKSGEEWDASLAYFDNSGTAQKWHDGDNSIFFTMPVYPTVDRMTYGGSYNSDCFTLRDARSAIEPAR